MNTIAVSRNAAADVTLAWLKKAVIDLRLCPFAEPVISGGRLDIVVSDAGDTNQLVADLDVELMRLAQLPVKELETTLLVVTQLLSDFEDFNDFLDIADALLAARGMVGDIQIASFHPQYCFDGADANDSGNWTNRAPWPTLHLLRESSIAAAVKKHPDVGSIPASNRERLATLSRRQWRSIFGVVTP